MTVRRLFQLTALIAGLGFVWFFSVQGLRPAFAYLLGALVSLGNLWLFTWLATSIQPGERSQKPWQAGLFIGRYIVMFGAGAVVVKALDVSPVPVLIGLLASSFAALASSVAEVFRSFRSR